MGKPLLYCPHCGKAISPALMAAALGAKGGKVRGIRKGLTSETARVAARKRWDKRAQTGQAKETPPAQDAQLKRILASLRPTS